MSVFKNVFILSVIWITVIYLNWNLVVSQGLENVDDGVEAMSTPQPESTTVMNTEDKPLQTPGPFSNEVWKISYYCRYHYYAQIFSNPQYLLPFVFRLTSCLVLVHLHHLNYVLDSSFCRIFWKEELSECYAFCCS